MSKKVTFEQAQERFKDREDIELCEDGWNGWLLKSKFFDFDAQDYFFAIPRDVLRRKVKHPKFKKNKPSLTFKEAQVCV